MPSWEVLTWRVDVLEGLRLLREVGGCGSESTRRWNQLKEQIFIPSGLRAIALIFPPCTQFGRSPCPR
jgi:hypothetical protein